MTTTTITITLAAAALYVLVAVWSARWLYAHWRAQTINEYAQLKAPANPAHDKDPTLLYEEQDDPRHSGSAMVLSIIWPVTIPALLVDAALRYLFINRLPLSPYDSEGKAK